MNIAKTFIISTFSSLIAMAVVLSGAHAKDVVGGRILSKDDGSIVKTTVKTSNDVAAKAISDLHNHVDKTALKTFAKSTVDGSSVLAREREVKAGLVQFERTTSIRFMEAILMLKLALARAF